MRRFDVCQAKGGGIGGEGGVRLVVVLQHHDFDELAGIIVAPMYRAGELPPLQRLRPQATIKRKAYVIAIDRLASLPKRLLGPPVANLEPLRYEMSKALDLIFAGF